MKGYSSIALCRLFSKQPTRVYIHIIRVLRILFFFEVAVNPMIFFDTFDIV